MSASETSIQKVRAKLLGCFPPGHATVVVGPKGVDHSRGLPIAVIPIELVPDDLRFPNKTFTMLLDRGEYIGIERE